jgi:hypothetical protein
VRSTLLQLASSELNLKVMGMVVEGLYSVDITSHEKRRASNIIYTDTSTASLQAYSESCR